MVKDIVKANKAAKMSCRKWNKNPFSRVLNRITYRKMAKEYWSSEQHQELIEKYKSGKHFINTYPWPYSDDNFADWRESDARDSYSLISDQSGFVIRHSPSYCAWKIFEATGIWPKRLTHERMDAKDWFRFLLEAGYAYVVKRTEPFKKGHNYVGINPHHGRFGLVVWLEDFEDNWVEFSTYYDGCYMYYSCCRSDFTWVHIK